MDKQRGCLVLSRSIGEGIYIGNDIIITVNKVLSERKVSLTIFAPKEIRISRSEGKVLDGKQKKL